MVVVVVVVVGMVVADLAEGMGVAEDMEEEDMVVDSVVDMAEVDFRVVVAAVIQDAPQGEGHLLVLRDVLHVALPALVGAAPHGLPGEISKKIQNRTWKS